MTYNPSIPQSTDLISQSQSQILTNFSQANTAFSVDHTAFDVVSNQGKHKKVTLVEQSDPVTSANEMALYSKDLAAVTTLYMRKESNGTVIQMSAQDPTIASSGSTFLPGGIIMKWGNTGVVSDNSVVTFASAFPTACWGVVITIIDPNATSKTINVKTSSLSTSQFLVRVSTGSTSAFYYAIGN